MDRHPIVKRQIQGKSLSLAPEGKNIGINGKQESRRADACLRGSLLQQTPTGRLQAASPPGETAVRRVADRSQYRQLGSWRQARAAPAPIFLSALVRRGILHRCLRHHIVAEGYLDFRKLLVGIGVEAK